MNKVNFENECFRSELINGETVVTVLQDNNKFFNVDVTGCKFITDEKGCIKDDFTVEALHQIYKYCNKNKASKNKLKLDIRNRNLNCLMSIL